MTPTTRRLLTIVAPLALLLAACSGGGASLAPTTPPAAEAPTDAPAPAADATVTLTENPLGAILADAEGRTLYAFTPDTDGVPTCYEDCAAAWPPLLADGDPVAGEGLDPALLTTVERTDGTTQLVYGAWPLYTFASDAAVGDTTGQGVGDKWFVIGADGTLIGQGTAGSGY